MVAKSKQSRIVSNKALRTGWILRWYAEHTICFKKSCINRKDETVAGGKNIEGYAGIIGQLLVPFEKSGEFLYMRKAKGV
jgi:hypothetical protein